MPIDPLASRSALTSLLRQMFKPDELHNALRLSGWAQDLILDLRNPDQVSPKKYWSDLDEGLAAYKLWRPFFELVLAMRPRWAPEIIAARAGFFRVVLFLGASPPDEEPLNIDAESQGIAEGLANATGSDRWVFAVEPAVTLDSWREAMLRERPNIVHFAGHGSPAGLETESGLYRADALGQLFAALAGQVDLVVLNACRSRSPAQALMAAGVPAVIGTSVPVKDRAARTFATALYAALAAEQELETAHQLACAAVSTAGLAADAAPFWRAPEPLAGALRPLP